MICAPNPWEEMLGRSTKQRPHDSSGVFCPWVLQLWQSCTSDPKPPTSLIIGCMHLLTLYSGPILHSSSLSGTTPRCSHSPHTLSDAEQSLWLPPGLI
jgi:hypothetical protein